MFLYLSCDSSDDAEHDSDGHCMQGEIEEVKALVDELMPQDHPYREHVDMSVEAMHSNSSYTMDQKIYQVKHLIHSLTSPLPERLRTRGLLGMHAEM